MADIGFANVEVLSAANTKVLAINNTRVSLEKGYGLMTPIATFEVAVSDILNALDVQPVKHGQLIAFTDKEKYETFKDEGIPYDGRCSVCNSCLFNTDKFCVDCGARMDLNE